MPASPPSTASSDRQESNTPQLQPPNVSGIVGGVRGIRRLRTMNTEENPETNEMPNVSLAFDHSFFSSYESIPFEEFKPLASARSAGSSARSDETSARNGGSNNDIQFYNTNQPVTPRPRVGLVETLRRQVMQARELSLNES